MANNTWTAVPAIAAAAAAAIDAGCATSLPELYQVTEHRSDASTNLELVRPHPALRANALILSPAARAWIESVRNSMPAPVQLFVEGEAAPDPAVARAVAAINDWQRREIEKGTEAELLAVFDPLDAPQTSLVKRAVERGDDHRTLSHLVKHKLSEAGRAHLLALFAERGNALRQSLGAAAFTIANTDVDDTTFAHFWDRGRYLTSWDHPYPGYRELLGAEGQFVTVVTARPLVLEVLTEGTLHHYREKVLGIPKEVDPARVNLSVAPGDLSDLVNTLEMGLVKVRSLVLERRLFPEASSVFNGDSGQGDWIAALVMRDLFPDSFPYATIHDVRPWSRPHQSLIRDAIAKSDELKQVYRDVLFPGVGGALGEDQAKSLEERLARIRADLARAVTDETDARHGRLDGVFLGQRGIFLYRNLVDLAIALAGGGMISDAAADRVIAAAAGDVRTTPDRPFGYDQHEGRPDETRLADLIEARAAGRAFSLLGSIPTVEIPRPHPPAATVK